MITSAELEKIPLFAGVDEQERRRLARRAADISLEPGEWLIREGEEPRFFVVLEGELEAIKDIVGQRRMLGRSGAGDFSGETPIFMGTASIVSVRAVTKCRVARAIQPARPPSSIPATQPRSLCSSAAPDRHKPCRST